MKFSDKDTIIEQIALLFASFVWTTVILSLIALYWVYQDINARWEFIAQMPPAAQAQAAAFPPTATPSPTATVWTGPPATVTSTPATPLPPTPIPTLVVQAPAVLPETLNADEAAPLPVIVHTEDEAEEFGVALESDSAETGSAPPPAPAAPVVAVDGGISPVRLVIESVGIDSDILPVGWEVVEQGGKQYSIWQVADFAIGWHKTTASLGQSGNTVMAGHHNVQGEIFRDLVNVEVGDIVVAYGANNQKYEYKVELKTIVKEKGEPIEIRQQNAQWISPTEDERLTFVTCWPYTNNTHRVIVVAKPL